METAGLVIVQVVALAAVVLVALAIAQKIALLIMKQNPGPDWNKI